MFSFSILLFICLLNVISMSKSDIFSKYDLLQSVHLDLSEIEKLKQRYADCVNKINRIDRNTMNAEIPEYMDILSNADFIDLLGNPSTSKGVTLWPNNTIPLQLDSLIDQKRSLAKRIVCAILFFHSETCIRFVKREEHHKNYVFVTNNGTYCSSDSVGMKGGKQQITLVGKSKSDCWKHGTIVHEFLHAVGQFHEHQRQDRDLHVYIRRKYIPPSVLLQFRTVAEMGYDNYDDIGDYDFSSVMHYGSKIGKTRVMFAKFAKYKYKSHEYTDQMGNRKRPTETDILKVNTRYGCSNSVTVTTTKPTSTEIATTLEPTTSEPIKTSKPEYPTRIVVIGGTSLLEFFYPDLSKYNKVMYLASYVDGHASHVNIDGYIVVAGGCLSSSHCTDCFAVDYILQTKLPVPNMKQSRMFHANSVVNDAAYICGGRDKRDYGKILSSCERIRSNKWALIASMAIAREGLAMASVNNKVYAIGGKNKATMNSVERYSPLSDTWEVVKSMKIKRHFFAATTLQSHIYACGGFSLPVDLSSCEKYNPLTNEWSFVKEMILPRRHFGLVADSRKLYAIGGCSGAQRSVEWYDPRQNKWFKHGTKLLRDRCGASSVILS